MPSVFQIQITPSPPHSHIYISIFVTHLNILHCHILILPWQSFAHLENLFKRSFSNILLFLFKTWLHLIFLKLQLMPDSSSTHCSFLVDKIKCGCWWFTKNIWEMWQNLAVNHLFKELFLFKENIKLLNSWDSWFLTSRDWEVSSKIQLLALLMNSQSQWRKHGCRNTLKYLLNIKSNSFSTFSYTCFNTTTIVDLSTW